MNNDIPSLIQERISNNNLIGDLRQEIERLNRRISNINKSLLEKCQHDWKIDNSYMDEHTVYKCSICGCYPNYSVNMSKYP